MYQFISDAGHGWLKVPLAEIKDLTFSDYSFRDGEYAYLEEDCDAPKFMREKGVTFDDIEEVHVEEFNRSNKWDLNRGRVIDSDLPYTDPQANVEYFRKLEGDHE